MKKTQSNVFALKAAQKKDVKSIKKWSVENKATTAGCSGPWARADDYWRGRDAGMWC